MQSVRLTWQSLAGQWVVLNSFGLVFVADVTDKGLVIGDGVDAPTIPLAIIRSVRLLSPDGHPGPEVAIATADDGTSLF